jgi:hypothetical protein
MHVFSHTWKIDPEIIYTKKQARAYTNPDVEYVCNSGTTLWNLGKEEKEKSIEHQ